ncbi:hypothetical protein [Dolichospermum sp. UHCC 0315A]|uniref:hypothetical protein n=1 Tax=Dolichospermum sp. UHCC 0315A TaxID=1914871 RepID=UPI00352C2774
MGDILTKQHEKSGLGYATIGSSIVLLSILGVCVLLTTIKPKSKGFTHPTYFYEGYKNQTEFL